MDGCQLPDLHGKLIKKPEDPSGAGGEENTPGGKTQGGKPTGGLKDKTTSLDTPTKSNFKVPWT